MILSVPAYAHRCTNQNVLVLLWLMRKLGKRYPDLREKVPGFKTFIEFGFYPKDLHMILQSARDPWREIADAGLDDNITIGELTMYDSTVRMRNTQASYKAEITNPRCIELICYLSGCLNNNLIEEEKPVKYFMLEGSLKKHFVYYGQDEV